MVAKTPRRHAALIGRWLRVLSAFSTLLVSAAALADKGASGEAGTPTLSTTLDDFQQPGTQPLGAGVPSALADLLSTSTCISCHAEYGDPDPFLMVDPHATWVSSMMAQSARDPVFWACLTIANQDAADSGQFCIRCHAPNAFLGGRSIPTDGQALSSADFEGINCNFCHRMVNPEYVAGISPTQDEAILNELAAAGLVPPEGSNSRYIIDPVDSRRGPFNDIPMNLHPGKPTPEIIHSPFHKSANLCWTCHDVSNPLMMRQPDGTFALNDLGQPHPTAEQEHMLPLHRTYSEWKNSYYSTVGVQHNGRFGGNHINNPEFIANGTAGIMKDCQDCHMPDTYGYGCNYEFDPFFARHDTPQHSFVGSNTWVLNAIRTVDGDGDGKPDFPDFITGLNDDRVNAAIARNTDLLEKASDLDVTQVGDAIRVRIFNRSGHKLPTGFPDGRRVWINVRFLDCFDNIIREHGAYDFKTGVLSADDTKVYEMRLGIQGAEYAKQIGHPEGHTFHFVLANAILKDNRIPPSGFSNSLAIESQSAPVGATYANGQNWDDTLFEIPAGARRVLTTVYYQLTSREFIEFLRDANVTDNRGQIAYDLWVEHGMSPPVVMDADLSDVFQPADVTQDGLVNIDDLLIVISSWGPCLPPPTPCPADVNDDGAVNVDDLLTVITAWGGC